MTPATAVHRFTATVLSLLVPIFVGGMGVTAGAVMTFAWFRRAMGGRA